MKKSPATRTAHAAPDSLRQQAVEWPFFALAVLAPLAFCTGASAPTSVKLPVICLLAVFMLIGLYARAFSADWRPARSALVYPAFAMFTWKLIASVYGGHFYSSAEPLLYSALYLIVFAAAAGLPRKEEQIVRTLLVAALAAAPIAIIGIFEHYGLRLSLRQVVGLGRVHSTMGNPTFLAAYFALFLPVQLCLFFTMESRRMRWALGASAGVTYLCVIWTYTRGIWLGMMLSAAMLAVLFLATEAKARILTRRRDLAALIAVLAAITAFAWATRSAPVDDSGKVSGDLSFAGRKSDLIRKSLMGAGIQMFLDRPVLGWGLGGYRAYQMNYISGKPVFGHYEMGEDHAHNDLIETAADQGVVGVGIYLWLIAAICLTAAAALRRASHSPARLLASLGVIGGLVAFFPDLMVNVSIHEAHVGVFVWMLLGALAALSASTDKSAAEKPVARPPLQKAGIAAAAVVVSAWLMWGGAASFLADVHAMRAGQARDKRDWNAWTRENLIALRIYPYATRSLYWLGLSYLEDGYAEDALAAMKDYQRKYPHAMRIDYELGRAHFRTGDYKQAASSYQTAARMDPENFLAWRGLAAAYYMTGDSEASQHAIARAVLLGSQARIAGNYETPPLRPQSGLGHYLIADDLIRAGLYADAIPELKRAAQESPEQAVYLTALGAAYWKTGKLSEAETALRRATAADPRSTDAVGYLASVYLEQGRKSEARRELLKAMSLTRDETRLAGFRQMLRLTQ
ncbi:MAG: tetratricopeptide repeat protein [Armatimonadota bacterium]|nr:tetratricopeptide repeat protein [Armatimonadota bacterium]